MRPLLALALFFGGASALVFELIWARRLGVFLGAESIAHAVVLSSFLGGLALGAAAFGRWADRLAGRALLLYAGLEGFVGLYGLVSPELIGAVERIWVAATAGQPATSSLLVSRMLVAAVVVAVPAAAMGGTLPAVVRFAVRDAKRTGETLSWFYLMNTLGGAAGVVVATLWWAPAWGFDVSLRVAASVDLVIALGALGLYARRPATVSLRLARSPASPLPPSSRRWLWIAMTTGLAALSLEIAYTRLFAIVFGSSSQAFALMLATFLVGIALGGLAAARAARGDRLRAGHGAGLALMAASGIVALQLLAVERLPYWQFTVAQALERRADVFPWMLGWQSAVAFVWMLPVTVATGAALPLLAQQYARSADSTGRDVGSLFAANTVGTVVGPLLASFLLLPWLGLRGTFLVSGVLLAAAGIATVRGVASDAETRRSTRWVGGLALVAVVGSALAPAWNASVLHAGGFRRWTLAPGSDYATFREQRLRSQVLMQYDGPEDSVVVLEDATGRRFLKVNGKTDASDGPDEPTQRWVAHLPLVLHAVSSAPGPRDVFIVGVGSGATAAAAARHGDVEVTAVELSRGVLRALPFFAHVNDDLIDAANVQILRADARDALRRADRPFDVIVSQPSNPWVAGNAALFTAGFFEEMRAHLAPGGVVAQWMHVYAMDDATLELVLDTFASVYPHVTVWWPQAVDMVLIGSEAPLEVDLDRLRRLVESSTGPLAGEPLEVSSAERFLSLQVASDAGFRALFDGGPPHHTDSHPLLDVRAPVAQFIGERPTTLAQLDERTRPDGGGLFLARLPLGAAEHADLLSFFDGRETPFSERLRGSLQYAVSGVPPGIDAFPGVATRATGLPVLLDDWAVAMAAPCPPSDDCSLPALDTCRSFADTAVQAYPLRATMFYRPDVDAAVAGLSACAVAYPAAGLRFEAAAAELLLRAGYRDRARGRVDALLARPVTPPVRRALLELMGDTLPPRDR